MSFQVIQAGLMEYLECLGLQERLLCARQNDEIQDTLILAQHPPTITIGRGADHSNIIKPPWQLKEMCVPVYETGRGGDVTYHGPGQLIGYPIVDLKRYGKDVHAYYSSLEQVIIELLKDYKITAGRDPSYPGVWVGEEKIAAIGITVKRWVTMHGFALNIFPDPLHTELIIPCGIAHKGVTALQKFVSREITITEEGERVIDAFARVFDLQPIDKGAASIAIAKEN